MITAAQLAVVISGDDKGAQDAMGRAGKSADGFGAHVKGMFENILAVTGIVAAIGVVTGSFSMLKDQFMSIVQAGMDEQNVMSQTATVLKSTGDASGLTAQQISDYADSMARLTGISNDQIQSSENILLTFTTIGKQVFPQAETSILDVATAMHEDLQSATVQVGKALDNPIKGMTALQRIGVTFTAQQIAQVKAMQKSGNMMGAQSIILKELQREFGGSAKAAGQTFAGELQRMNVTLDQAKEKIGLALIPILMKLFNAVQPLINGGLDLMSKAFAALEPLLDKLPGLIGPLISMIGSQLKDAFGDAGKAVGGIGGLFQKVRPYLLELKAVFISLFTVAKAVAIPVLKALGIIFASVLMPAFKLVAGIVQKDILPALIGLGTHAKQIGDTLNSILTPAAQILGDLFNNIVAPAIQFIVGLIGDLMPILNTVAGVIVANVAPALAQLHQAFQQAAPFIHQVFNALNNLKPILIAVAGIAAALFVTGFGIVISVIRGVIGALSGVFQVLSGVITVFSGFWDIISGLFTLNGDKISKGFGELWSGIQNIVMGAVHIITGFIGGFISGIITFFQHLFDKLIGHSIVTDLIKGILSWFQKLLDLPVMIGKMVIMMLERFLMLEMEALAIVNRMIMAFLNFIAGWITKAVDGAGKVAKGILGALAALPGDVLSLGGQIIQGLINGLKNGLGAVGSMVQNIGSTVVNGFKNLFGIHSPSAIMHEMGRNLSQGLINGFKSVNVAGAWNQHISGIGTSGLGTVPGQQFAAAGAGAAGGVTQVNMIVDGRRLATVLMPHNAHLIRSVAAIRDM
jgi:phage-related protein